MGNINFDDESFDDDLFESDLNLEDSEEVLEDDIVIDDTAEDIKFEDNLTDEDDTVEDEDNNLSDGVRVDGLDLHDDDTEQYDNKPTDLINSSGHIVVQDSNDTKEKGFALKYINIENIIVSQRIRKMRSVESLVQSIKSTGLLSPLIVAPTATDEIYVLLEGFRRLQACAKVGLAKVPCIINNRVNTPEIPMIEAMYNHSQKYSIQEQVDYINYLKTEQGIMNPDMIEYLLQMNNGDYTKLEDILSDNDEDIVTKLFDGVYDIATAYKKLEQRRKKESAQEKEDQRAAKVYDDEAASGAEKLSGTGEEADGEGLTDEQIKELSINPENLDEEVEGEDLNDMIEDDKNMEGFEPHKQKTDEREYVDPIIKKTVMARDESTCQCCKRGGETYVDILDYHHILPVFLGGADTPENGIMLCLDCHRFVHLYSTGDLHIDSALLNGNYEDLDEKAKEHYGNKEIFEDEKKKFKRIIKLGSIIRKGIVKKGYNREQYKKEHSNHGIGRRKPGVNAEQEKM